MDCEIVQKFIDGGQKYQRRTMSNSRISIYNGNRHDNKPFTLYVHYYSLYFNIQWSTLNKEINTTIAPTDTLSLLHSLSSYMTPPIAQVYTYDLLHLLVSYFWILHFKYQ